MRCALPGPAGHARLLRPRRLQALQRQLRPRRRRRAAARASARALAEAVSGHGRAYRLGGDEFCILLDGRSARATPSVARRRGALRARQRASRSPRPAASSALPEDADSVSDALNARRRADVRRQARRSARRRATSRRSDVLMQLLNEREPTAAPARARRRHRWPSRSGGGSAWTPNSSTSCAARPSCTTSASWRSPTRSSTSPAR